MRIVKKDLEIFFNNLEEQMNHRTDSGGPKKIIFDEEVYNENEKITIYLTIILKQKFTEDLILIKKCYNYLKENEKRDKQLIYNYFLQEILLKGLYSLRTNSIRQLEINKDLK